MILRHPISVDLDKLVDHLLDGVDVELAARVGVEHCRLVDVLLLSRASRLDGEELNVDVGHIHCRTLYGERSDVAGVDAASVNKAGNLNASLLGKVGDKVTLIQHVTADLEGLVGNHRLHNIGRVLAGTVVLLDTALFQLGILLLPAFDLVDAAAGILVKGNVVSFYKLGVLALDVEHIVLSVMLGGFGTVVAEILDVLKTYLVAAVGICDLGIDTALDLGVEVNTVLVSDIKKPSHVVDTCDDGLVLIELVAHIDGLEEAEHAGLNAVAKTYGLNTGVALNVA